VETAAELEACRALGFDFFQGYFLQRPETVQAWRAPTSRLTVLDLIVRLNDPAVPVDLLERAICRDPGLGYRLLHAINSSYSGMPRKVRSIREAMLQLGLEELHKLCWLLLLAGVEEPPAAGAGQSLVRACMCEALAERAGLADRDSYFMAGMLSMLETFAGPPLEQALERLPLHPEVRNALLSRDGDLGAALNCAECYECGDWGEMAFRRLSSSQIAAAHLDAVERAEQSWRALPRTG
jgi:EAL and modified HD-GYP domain-containing signal transduction protein